MTLALIFVFPCAINSSTASSQHFDDSSETGAIVIDATDVRAQLLGIPTVIHIVCSENGVNLLVTIDSISIASFDDLRPGQYVVQVSAGNNLAETAVTVLAGQTIPVSVEVSDGASPHITLQLHASHASGPAPSNIASMLPKMNRNSCPINDVIQRASERLEEFVENVNRISAIEVLEHERLDKHGQVIEREKHRFNYVAIIEEISPGALNVDEYRNGAVGAAGGFPHDIATVGMPSLAMIFHHSHLPEFEMTCDGIAVWHDRPVWRVLFQQRRDQVSRMSHFRLGGKIIPVLLKGSAWIDSENYQILHLETDLLEPVPQVKLVSEHQALDYGPVQFADRKTVMWLPLQAEIFLDSAGRRFHHRHTYSDYRIFSVEVGQKIGSPKQIP